MIQRIQTLYLIIVIILLGQTFFFPFVRFIGENEIIAFSTLRFDSGEWLIPLTILFGFILMMTFFAIVTFKKRMIQVRMLIINTLLLLGSIGLIGFYVWQVHQRLPDYRIGINFTAIYPLIAIILNFMAIRGIKKDEALVRSANRIR